MKKRKPPKNMVYYSSQLTPGGTQVLPVKPLWLIDFPESPKYRFFLYHSETQHAYFVLEVTTGMGVSSNKPATQKDALEKAAANLKLYAADFDKIVADFIKKHGAAPSPHKEEPEQC